MFNKLLRYIKNDEYLISFSNGYVHIFNFKQLKIIKESLIEILLNDNKLLVITGTNFMVAKMEKNEILFKGSVDAIDIK